MPPKGRRVCLEVWRCVHGEDNARSCRVCREDIRPTIAREEAYLCLDCRSWSTRVGVSWPKKGSKMVAKKSETINIKKPKEVSIDSTCLIHQKKFKPGKRCEDCIDSFEREVSNCGTCEGHDPDNMEYFCKKHKTWWEKQKLSWQCDPKLIDLAEPYPIGRTEDFLKGLENICMAPRKK